ncbi:MAG: hypothetical protein WBC55_05090 [Dehalococcoidia bacterium]
MSEKHRQEKAEKQEKEEEKHEKSWEEKWRRDPLNVATWALVLLWLGVVLILATIGSVKELECWETWAVFFGGAGVLLLAQVVIRLAVPSLRQRVMGGLILGLVFLAIGLGGVVGWAWVWPVVVIAIALIILIYGLVIRRR